MDRIGLPIFPQLALEINPEDEREFGPCPDCGELTRRVWDYVYRSEEALAAYYVEWTPGHELKEATFDLIIGRWGENTDSSDRQAVSVAFKRLETGPAFMVQNANGRCIGSSSLISKELSREDVIGKPVADSVFDICDLVYLADPRLEYLRV